MRRTERFADAVEQFRSAFEGMQSEVWTSLQGTITAVDLDKLTCSVQPGTMALLTGQDGTQEWHELPLLLDCPIQFPSGGGFALTFPLAPGDEVLVVFASRCIDNWWAQQGEAGPSGLSRAQAEIRMHDLSDGFAVPGLFNATRVPSAVSATDVQLRNASGTSFYSIKANGDLVAQTTGNLTANVTGNLDAEVSGDASVIAFGAVHLKGETVLLESVSSISLTATTTLTMTSPAIAMTAAVAITGSLSINGEDFTTHKHLPGTYQAGSTHITGNSGVPV